MTTLARDIAVIAGAALALLAAPPVGAQAPDARPPKRLIATGGDSPDTAQLRAHLAVMERRPFDGVVLRAVGRDDAGGPVDLARSFGREAWKPAWFQTCIDDLQACRFERFTDNFVLVGANPGDVDWFDDAGWAQIVEHWRIAARVAKTGGLRGICFDPEPYTRPHDPFRYGGDPPVRESPPFEAVAAKARERGRAVMRAVAAEHPSVTILAYFLLCASRLAAAQPDPRPALAGRDYGLLPAFLDGWLDEAPPTVTLVDGCENAYRFNSDLEFLEAANEIRNGAQALVSPANRSRYRAQVQAGFGIYLDAHVSPPGSAWHIDRLGGTPARRLRANVAAALRAADQYVWIYGERHRWFPLPGAPERTDWNEAMPGCEEALRLARDPAAFARARIAALAREGTLLDLAQEGDFAAGPEGGAPAGWTAWQDEKSRGALAWDGTTGASGAGSAKASGAASGCFLQAVPVRPGALYAVRASRRLAGRGDAELRLRWQTAEGRWTTGAQDVIVTAPGPRDAWSEMVTAAEVPPGAGRLVVLLTVIGQAAPGDAAWFDDVRVHRLE